MEPPANPGRFKFGLDVLDIDGEEGERSLERLVAENGPLPLTTRVETFRGYHLYFLHHGTPLANRKLAEGIDFKTDGGIVVAAQSLHESGWRYEYAKVNRWGKGELAALPAWVAKRMMRSAPPPSLHSNTETVFGSEFDARQKAWAEKALANEVARVQSAKPGLRNDTLNLAALKLGHSVAGGVLEERLVVSALTAAALAAGLGVTETANTIRSGLAAGFLTPRTLEIGGRNKGASSAVESRPDPLTEQLAQLGQTDADLAERFAIRFKGKVIFTPGRGFLVFDGKRYVRDDKLHRHRLSEEGARNIADEARYLRSDTERSARIRFSQQSLSKSALDRMLDLAKSRLVVADDRLDADPWLLNVDNGTVDLRTGELHPHDPAQLLTRLAKFTFDNAAACPGFEAFLSRALGDDVELVRYVQKAAGLSLTGDIEHHVFFIAHGPARTGKSTFVNLFRDLLGDYGVHTPTETLLAKAHDNGIPNDLARLQGARMVTAIEANWNKLVDEARLKSMTGGDPISARFLRQEFFEFRPEFKLWIAANDFPQVRGSADAFWERARVIPFMVRIPDDERDRDLGAKLKAEASGILNWAVRGCLACQKEGLGLPAAIRRAGRRWQDQADSVRKFADAELIREHGSILRAGDLIAHYAAWCRTKGETPVDDRKLKAKLLGLGFEHDRTRMGSVWKEVKIRVG